MALKRTLGLWDVFALAAGVMISSGLFVLPGIAFEAAGPAVVFSYAIAALMAVPAMLSQAELATAMPKAGGTYFFVERSLGTLPGLLAGLANWFGIALKSTFALIGIGAFAPLIFGELDPWVVKAITVALCVAFSVMNAVSVHGVKRFQSIAVAIVVMVLLVFVAMGIGSAKMTSQSFTGFAAKGWSAIFATAGLVFISYGGLTKIASVAEEVQNPARNIPLGMGAAILVVSLLYVAVVTVIVGTVEPDTLGTTLTPLSEAGMSIAGTTGKIVLSVCAIAALFTAANGGIMAASRNPMAMSRDGLLPDMLQRVSKRFGTPIVSVLLTAAFMIVVLVAVDLKNLVKTASLMMLVLFAMVNIAVLVIRASKVQNYRPQFRSPLYPWMQLVGLACYIGAIVMMCDKMLSGPTPNATPLVLTGCFAGLGVLWYAVYIRGRVKRESAFVYWVKSVVAKDMYRGTLDEELKQIALERDEVVHDRFDHLVVNCAVMNLDGATLMDDAFNRAAKILEPRLELDAEDIYVKLTDRERLASTVISPGLAIPHFMVEGEGVFEMLLIRCRAGIMFPHQQTPVKAMFVLAGSQDQRNAHLRALMAIAHTVQEEDFMRRWLGAIDAEHLRDIMLLSQRKRNEGH